MKHAYFAMLGVAAASPYPVSNGTTSGNSTVLDGDTSEIKQQNLIETGFIWGTQKTFFPNWDTAKAVAYLKSSGTCGPKMCNPNGIQYWQTGLSDDQGLVIQPQGNWDNREQGELAMKALEMALEGWIAANGADAPPTAPQGPGSSSNRAPAPSGPGKWLPSYISFSSSNADTNKLGLFLQVSFLSQMLTTSGSEYDCDKTIDQVAKVNGKIEKLSADQIGDVTMYCDKPTPPQPGGSAGFPQPQVGEAAGLPVVAPSASSGSAAPTQSADDTMKILPVTAEETALPTNSL